MGKGSNVQKAQAARERNQKKMGKSAEERKAASDQAKKDAAGKMCVLCRQTFMINSRPPLLYQHVVAKHPANTKPEECFPELAGWDPNDPDGTKAAAASKATAAKKPAKKKKSDAGDLDALLDVGLSKGKKKK